MKLKFLMWATLMSAATLLGACSSGDETSGETEAEASETTSGEQETAASETREITYLGETYELPQEVDRIVITGAMEAMEDAAALGVEPVGAVTIADEFPEILKEAMGDAESIGEKQQPNFEKILQLQPDVILGTTKFPKEVVEKLEKIAPTILVSHIAANWQDNLKLMGDLGGKEAEAEKQLEEYAKTVEQLKPELSGRFGDGEVVAIRVRGGKLFIYPEKVFVNPILYGELGLNIPEAVTKAEAQEEISVEQLAEMNPDHIIMQIQESENGENEQVYEQISQNPIVRNITAFKEDQVYVNLMDPILEGSSIFGKNQFLQALQELE